MAKSTCTNHPKGFLAARGRCPEEAGGSEELSGRKKDMRRQGENRRNIGTKKEIVKGIIDTDIIFPGHILRWL